MARTVELYNLDMIITVPERRKPARITFDETEICVHVGSAVNPAPDENIRGQAPAGIRQWPEADIRRAGSIPAPENLGSVIPAQAGIQNISSLPATGEGVDESPGYESAGGGLDVKHKYLYGGRPAEAESAAGIKGVIIRALNGTLVFRVYHDRERFTDYEIRHDDLNVTIDEDALAAFYKVGESYILDHSPQVLGLKKIAD